MGGLMGGSMPRRTSMSANPMFNAGPDTQFGSAPYGAPQLGTQSGFGGSDEPETAMLERLMAEIASLKREAGES